MPKLCSDREVAKKAAILITNFWLKSKRDHAAMVREFTALMANAADCPECEICCALGICCPLGSEKQVDELTNVLMKDGSA